jgi:hypothetical protein
VLWKVLGDTPSSDNYKIFFKAIPSGRCGSIVRNVRPLTIGVCIKLNTRN